MLVNVSRPKTNSNKIHPMLHMSQTKPLYDLAVIISGAKKPGLKKKDEKGNILSTWAKGQQEQRQEQQQRRPNDLPSTKIRQQTWLLLTIDTTNFFTQTKINNQQMFMYI